jgi:hypothetical protein
MADGRGALWHAIRRAGLARWRQEPQSGKRHPGRRVSTSRNAPRRHLARTVSSLSGTPLLRCVLSLPVIPCCSVRGDNPRFVSLPRRFLLAHSFTVWQRRLPGVLARVRFASQSRLILQSSETTRWAKSGRRRFTGGTVAVPKLIPPRISGVCADRGSEKVRLRQASAWLRNQCAESRQRCALRDGRWVHQGRQAPSERSAPPLPLRH